MENDQEKVMNGDFSEVDEIVVISIETMLGRLPKVNANFNTIYQVPKNLLEMKPGAYVPQFISIGPFHHGAQKDLITNEHYKLQGFYNFLHRINNNNIGESLLLKEVVKKSKGCVREARNCYATPINMREEEFVMMMLVDACFVVEFFILLYDGKLRQSGKLFNVDYSFYQGVYFDILLDLIKLENQVPFFLLRNLFDLIPKYNLPKNEDAPISFIDLTDMTLKALGFVRKYEINGDLYDKDPKHLLDFLGFYFEPLSLDGDHAMRNNKLQEREIKNNSESNMNNEKKKKKNSGQWRLSPPSITELCEAGVSIKVAENKNLCCTNISFENGVLEIPCIVIGSSFEVMIRNLIVFDHYPAGNQNRYVIQYVLFLDDLINTEQDVRLLAKAGVIISTLGGSDKEISELFNNFNKFSILPTSSHFDNISKALRLHCNGRWNKAKASLKHNYFNTPWAAISFVAATFLIIFTLLQTIFSAISAFP